MARRKGELAEDAALKYLLAQGCSLVQRNFHCRGGEIDLIIMDKEELAFVEVRQRRSEQFGGSIESVDYHKQKKLHHAAETWLQQNPRHHCKGCRFDVIAMSGTGNGTDNPFKFDWIIDAF